MKKHICLVLVLSLSLFFGACTGLETQEKKDDTTLSSNKNTTLYEGASKTHTPSHSKLYLTNCSQQQMLDYFGEIVFNSEYGTGTSRSVKKWNVPIRYRIYGTATKKDLEVLTDLFAQLNKIDGFPGIYAADDEENLIISFLGVEDFNTSFSEFVKGEDAYGATEFWYYNDTNEIYTARIGYRTDVDQATRVSILIEEIINMLGVSDTEMREDSIVYQYSNDNTALSDIDWVILKLLYDTKIKCGMNADSCNDILKKIYY